MRNLEPPAQKRTQAQPGGDFLRTKQRLGAELRIIMKHKVFQIKAGRQRTQSYVTNIHLSS
jgi:hypothetical protein